MSEFSEESQLKSELMGLLKPYSNYSPNLTAIPNGIDLFMRKAQGEINKGQK
ncbi:hypothetical protein NSP_2350 [Nodularia spumigena CCY9414]|nr:hypothetical protein NSP_2350 [Nodularia spumigena CCY9414]